MKTTNARRALERAGFEIEEQRREFAFAWDDGVPTDFREVVASLEARRPGSRYYLEIDLNPRSTEDRIGSIRVRTDGQDDDLQSDYFAGHWAKNLKQAIESIDRSEASDLDAHNRAPQLRALPIAQPVYGYLDVTA